MESWIRRAKHELERAYAHGVIQEQTHVATDQELKELLLEMADSRFTLPAIKEHITSCQKRWTFILGSVRLDILCNRMGKKLREQIVRSLHRAVATMSMFGTRDIHVVLLPIHEPRHKPDTGEMVGPRHVNGGYTYQQSNTVYIYRLEEWPKVMLHELLHHARAVQGIRWTKQNISSIYALFGIDTAGCPINCSTRLEPTEAVVEAWAIFLHTAYMSHETGRNFYRLLQDEMRWNDHHTRWILEKQAGMGAWREDTHAFSYIVLRGILLHHLEELLQMPMPYKPRMLLQLWTTGRKEMDSMDGRKVQQHGTLRMSRYGNY
jgi:hypothetical protein